MARGRRDADHALAVALACGASHDTAASQLQISKRTITRRLAEPKFRALVKRIRSDYVDRKIGTLTASALAATTFLLQLVNDTKALNRDRALAARTILHEAGRARLEAQVEEELEELRTEIKRVAKGAEKHS